MASGYSQLNSNGYTQIDDAYSNFGLIASGTGTTTSGAISFPNQAYGALVAINMAYGSANLLSLKSLTTNSFTLLRTRTTQPEFSYSYRVYGKIGAGQISAEPYGMRVFNAAGSATFDSGFQYLRIRAVFGIQPSAVIPTNTVPSTTIYPITHSVGGTPFLVLTSGPQAAHFYRNSVQSNWYSFGVGMLSNTQLSVQTYLVATISTTGLPTSNAITTRTVYYAVGI